MSRIDVIIPARNESEGIAEVCRRVIEHTGQAPIVVDDGSDDGTGELAAAAGARVIRHPYPKGNGAAIKAGARSSDADVLIFMDGDGQHDPADIPRLLSLLDEGFDLVVGARTRRQDQASLPRYLANWAYNRISSWLAGQRVADLTSGFRAARRVPFMEILPLLPNGFSYPTTSTMAFYRAGHSVTYLPIAVAQRDQPGTSHIRPIRDGARFFTIIFKVVTLYSPLKVFAPASAALFAAALSYYAYTYLSDGRFTNMGVLLFVSAILVFLIGLIAEQITMLTHLQLHGRGRPTPPPEDQHGTDERP